MRRSSHVPTYPQYWLNLAAFCGSFLIRDNLVIMAARLRAKKKFKVRISTEEKYFYHMIYLLTVIGLTRGGNSKVHIYTQTIHRATQ